MTTGTTGTTGAFGVVTDKTRAFGADLDGLAKDTRALIEEYGASLDPTDPLYRVLNAHIPALILAVDEMSAMVDALGEWVPEALVLLEAVGDGFLPSDTRQRARKLVDQLMSEEVAPG